VGVPTELFEEFEILKRIKRLFKKSRIVVRNNNLALSIKDRFDIIVVPRS